MIKLIKIEGMSCGHCSAAVTKALQAVAGVKSVAVNLAAKEASVELSAPVEDAQLKHAVEAAGYEVVEIK